MNKPKGPLVWDVKQEWDSTTSSELTTTLSAEYNNFLDALNQENFELAITIIDQENWDKNKCYKLMFKKYVSKHQNDHDFLIWLIWKWNQLINSEIFFEEFFQFAIEIKEYFFALKIAKEWNISDKNKVRLLNITLSDIDEDDILPILVCVALELKDQFNMVAQTYSARWKKSVIKRIIESMKWKSMEQIFEQLNNWRLLN